MKLWILSDLHQEIAHLAWKPEAVPEHDVLILAGDIHKGARSAIEYATQLTDKPKILLAGNHEFYANNIDEELSAFDTLAAKTDGLFFLENDAALIHETRFVGATLWTDFRVLGEEMTATSKAYAARTMPDFFTIAINQEVDGKIVERRYTPDDAVTRFEESRAFIETELVKPHKGPTVIVTHHAPHKGSIHPRFGEDHLTGAFVSDLSAMIEHYQPALWVHGHVHDQFDYSVGETRIVSNPRGYNENEQTGFRPALVIEV